MQPTLNIHHQCHHSIKSFSVQVAVDGDMVYQSVYTHDMAYCVCSTWADKTEIDQSTLTHTAHTTVSSGQINPCGFYSPAFPFFYFFLKNTRVVESAACGCHGNIGASSHWVSRCLWNGPCASASNSTSHGEPCEVSLVLPHPFIWP